MTGISRTALVVGVCSLMLIISSCGPAWMQPLTSPKDLLSAGRSFFDRPFQETDHVSFSQGVSTGAIKEYRIRPATTVTGRREMTLEDCRAMALANSLDIQKVRSEETAQAAMEYSNRTKVLPHFLFSGELSSRDNEAFSYSEVLGQMGVTPQPGTTGTGVNQFSTGRERQTWRYTMESRWTPTDAALAYYLSRSSRNDKRKQHYLRVRVAQRLVGVVEASYYKLLSLQKVIPSARKLVDILREATAKNERLLDKKLATADRYQRIKKKLIAAEGMLASLRNEAEQQRNLLASAMQLSPEYCVDGGFFVVGEIPTPDFDERACDLEMIAVRNRPEAYVAGLTHLNSVNDVRRTIIKSFPKVTGFLRYTRDKDKHLYERDWKDVGMLVYFDIMEWSADLLEYKASRGMADKTYHEVGAVALGITSEVRATALKYQDAVARLNTASKTHVASKEVLEMLNRRAAMDAQEKLALLEAQAETLNDQITTVRAVGDGQAALAELRSAMGVNYVEALPK
jgi:outer membrane protein TolC